MCHQPDNDDVIATGVCQHTLLRSAGCRLDGTSAGTKQQIIERVLSRIASPTPCVIAIRCRGQQGAVPRPEGDLTRVRHFDTVRTNPRRHIHFSWCRPEARGNLMKHKKNAHRDIQIQSNGWQAALAKPQASDTGAFPGARHGMCFVVSFAEPAGMFRALVRYFGLLFVGCLKDAHKIE